MTREEAIKCLKWLTECTDDYSITDEDIQAIDMAIKSLNDELNCECCMWREKAEALEQTKPKSSICTRCENKDFCKETLRIYGLPNMRVEECKEYREKPIPTSLLNSEPSIIACDKIDELDMLERMYNEQTEPSDLISRAEVHKVLSLLATEGGKDAKLLFSDAHESIDNLPSVSAEREGEWIETAEQYYVAINEKGGGVDENTPYFLDEDIACSECFAIFNVFDNETDRFNYCPNCGARMGEVKGK